MSKFQLRPEPLRSDTPISVLNANPKEVYTVTPVEKNGVEAFTIEASQVSGQWIAQFMVSMPGKYRLATSKVEEEILVLPKVELRFFVEFGIFLMLMLTAMGGIALWAYPKIRNTEKQA